MDSCFFLVFILISFAVPDISVAVSLEEDLAISKEQHVILKKFREDLEHHLPHEYMKKDIYLIRWLRATDFDVPQAKRMLLNNLKWRAEQKMDTVMFEDWKVFEFQYPYFLEGCDREGRPIATASVGAWDVRKAILSGQQERLQRYTAKLFEEITFLIRTAQNEGKNVTQFSIILNLNDFNLATNFCPACLPFYLNWITTYENHYPGSLHKFTFVNTPEIYKTILDTLQPAAFYHRRYKDLLEIHGKNRKEWQSKILKDISQDQLTIDFGGTKEAAFEPGYLRSVMKLPC